MRVKADLATMMRFPIANMMRRGMYALECWRNPFAGFAFLLMGAGSSPAWAHGMGYRYDLPIPLSFYIWGAGATVALSFLGFALFLRQEQGALLFAEWRSRWRIANMITSITRMLGAGMLALIIVAGFFGNQNPIRNIAPVAIWIIMWVGLGFLSMMLGDIWAAINPWNTAFTAADNFHRRVRSGAALSLGKHYPQWLGVWPAFVMFLLFAWMELVWSGRNVPAQLSAALLIYSIITWTGMFVFGRETWLERGEVFRLVFGIFARCAPIALSRDGRAVIVGRLPGVGLLEDRPLTISMVALVIALLATVTFDGFMETPLWARVDIAVLDSASDSSFWAMLDLREDQAVRLVRTIALIGAIILFLAAYAIICWIIAAISGDREMRTGTVGYRFVLTLVPISIAYHVAHYFSYLFIGGQYAIPLVSDPLGLGWNLFGTATYLVDVGLVSPRLQWAVAVISVVLGHVISVCLSHVTALRVFSSRRTALVSQIPMVLLMIGYTMISLWILSQPIVETPTG
jgi:hypothetical protein